MQSSAAMSLCLCCLPPSLPRGGGGRRGRRGRGRLRGRGVLVRQVRARLLLHHEPAAAGASGVRGGVVARLASAAGADGAEGQHQQQGLHVDDRRVLNVRGD